MKIKVHEKLIPYMIKYEEFRRYAERFKKTDPDQRIWFNYRSDDSDYPYISDYVKVEQYAMGCYFFR